MIVDLGGFVGVELADAADDEGHKSSASEPEGGVHSGCEARGDKEDGSYDVENDGQCFHKGQYI